MLDQAIFDNTNLSVVKWLDVPVLGDELSAQDAKDSHGARKSRQQRIDDYQAAVRAYRRLAVALQANGMSEEASAYLYRAQIMNAIHGRVFFAQFHLDTLQSWLATIESVFGIVIEGVFVAMLIQRFFGK